MISINPENLARVRRKSLFCAALIVVCASRSAEGGTPPRAGWRKVALNYLFAQPNASAAAALAQHEPVEILEDYDADSVAYVRVDRVDRVRELARPMGIHAVEHDEYDFIETGAGTIDTRQPILIPRKGRSFAPNRPGEYGLYIVQFRAPLKPQWLRAIQQSGAFLVTPIIVNGYLVGATPAMAEVIRLLQFVQWLEPLHPFLKGAPRSRDDPEARIRCVVELAPIPGAQQARARARALLVPGTDRTDSYSMASLRAVGSLTATSIELLLEERSVIGVYEQAEPRISDERQAMSITANVQTETETDNDVPVQPGTYTTWLYDPSRCSVCNRLSLDGFKVGVADTGFYEGTTSILPQDVRDVPTGRVQYGTDFIGPSDFRNCGFGQNYVTRTCTDGRPCDLNYHGTFVTGILVGDGQNGTGMRDSGSFYMGTGIVPSAGVVVTKHMNGSGLPTSQNIFAWAGDAATNGAFIQNLSHNDTNAAAGTYNEYSQNYDKVVRGIGSNGLATPYGGVALTVSAGNGTGNGVVMTRSPATAKNVIAVGAAEGVRADHEERVGPNWPEHPRGDTFRNIWRFSCHGTTVAQDGTGTKRLLAIVGG